MVGLSSASSATGIPGPVDFAGQVSSGGLASPGSAPASPVSVSVTPATAEATPPTLQAREAGSDVRRRPGPSTMAARLADHVDGFMQRLQSGHKLVEQMLKTPVPSLDGVPHGKEISALVTWNLESMSALKEHQTNMELVGALRSVTQKAMDKALEMKD